MPSPSLNSTISPSLLTRWYIDTRSLTASAPSLPLLSTLQEADQERVKAFYHLADRHMSLASYLLKYLFIHRACRVPWDEIQISRTPAPHKRPCYIPVQGKTTDRREDSLVVPNIEFNVSHQASLVGLAGCIIPRSDSGISTPPKQHVLDPNPSSSGTPSIPQIGIDITCTDDPARRNRDAIKTEGELLSFIDIFSEVFSNRELNIMKSARVPATAASNTSPGLSETSFSGSDQMQRSIKYRIRLFYTYWALKEAYIKMTGEALLAPWLRQLEFTNVTVPSPPSRPNGHNSNGEGGGASTAWGVPETGIEVWLHGERVRDVRIEVVAFGDDYMFATAGRGAGFGRDVGVTKDVGGSKMESAAVWGDFSSVDIERDIGPCAKGECSCLIP